MSTDSLDQILADYLRRIDAGEEVDREEFLARHASHAADLRSFFAHRDAMQQMAGAIEGSGRGSSGDQATLDADGEKRNGSRLPRVRYFGDYELLEEIARGGMGVVYRARQVSLNRVVALKMILSGELASDDAVRRFRQEAEAAANLDHPHIVPIYEIGTHESQHYFSMKLIEGGSLAQKLKESKEGMPEREAARLLAIVARAIHHAHQRGLLHRDLKPANILLDANGEPHITDFGLAKKVEGGSDLTHSGAILGTPSYMSPEQAQGEKDLTTSCDIFSLGAILYEMLVGQPPFRGATPMETVLKLLSSDPARPSSLRASLDPDLETIALKCLDKDPAHRYDSAAALADDLDRWLRGEPIAARPTTTTEQLLKWTRRNPAIAALIGASAIALLAFIGLGVSASYQAILQQHYEDAVAARAEAEAKKQEADTLRTKAEELRARAESSEHSTKEVHYAADISLAQHEWERTKLARARYLLERQRPAPGEADRRGLEWSYLWRLTHLEKSVFLGHESPVTSIAFSQDGKQVYSGDQASNGRTPGCVRRWNLAKPEEASILWSQESQGMDTYHGGVLAMASSSKAPLLAFGDGAKIRLYSTPAGEAGHVLEGHNEEVTRIDFSPDGALLASGTWSGEVKIWDVATGREKFTLKGPRTRPLWELKFTLKFTPAGQLLLGSYQLQLWDLGLKQSVADFPDVKLLTSLAVSPDGKWVAGGDREGVITVWDFAGRQVKHVLRGHTKWISGLCFAPDNKRLVSVSYDATICVWQFGEEKRLATYKGHDSKILDLSLAPDGQTFASASADKSVRIWKLDGDPARTVLGDQPWSIMSLAAIDGGRTLVVGNYTSVVFHDAATLRIKESIDVKHWLFGMALSPNGKILATCGNRGESAQEPGVVKLWDIPGGKLRARLDPPMKSVHLVEFSPDGELVSATGKHLQSESIGFAIWNVADGKEAGIWLDAVHGVFSADSRTVALAGAKGVWLWDRATKKSRDLLAAGSDPILDIRFAPRGSGLAVSRHSGAIELWDATTGKQLWRLPRQAPGATALVCSPDGATLAAVSPQETLLCDVASGKLRAKVVVASSAVAFSADSRSLITTASEVQLWQASTGQHLVDLGDYGGFEMTCVVASPDGAFIAVGGGYRDENPGVFLWRK